MTLPAAVANHYAGGDGLAGIIAERVRAAGKDMATLTTTDLATIDEFHIRGRQATLELAAAMKLKKREHVLDVGSGLGGPARTLAERLGCQVTGIDLTPAFVDAANQITDWLELTPKPVFQVGDATAMPFADHSFDAAITLHVGMNIADKPALYREIARVLKPGRVLGLYDVLQGEGGEVVYPVPWAREASISHLVTTGELARLLEATGWVIRAVIDSTAESASWFGNVAQRIREHGAPALSFQAFLGEDFASMADNLARNLIERRVRTVSVIARSAAC